VYLGAATGETAYVKKLFVGRADRELVRQRAAQAALEMALRLAQGKTPTETQTLTKQEQHTTAALDKLDAAFVSARQNA
jgi:nicotinamide-nucleotide amidase